MRRLLDALPALLLTAALLAVWEAACRLLNVPVYFLPPPSAVAVALIDNAPVLAGSAAQTFWMALKALIVAIVLGGGLAVAVSLSRSAERAVAPLAVTLQVTPVVAIAPLVLIWAGLDHADRAVTALAAAVAFFPVFSGVLTGLKAADPCASPPPCPSLWRESASQPACRSSAPSWPSSSPAPARPKAWPGACWRPATACARPSFWPPCSASPSWGWRSTP